MLKAGELDRRITFSNPVSTENKYGEGIITYEPVATVWAKVIEAIGDEKEQADQIIAIGLTSFTIRYRRDINEKTRITYEGQEYNIEAIAEIGRREGLEIRGERRGERLIVIEAPTITAEATGVGQNTITVS